MPRLAKYTHEPWVVSQHRTMSRWVTSTIGETVGDFSADLADGLVLVKLVNCIMAETGQLQYKLKPVYARPTFKVQKVENVDDVLKFCQLVLNVNVSTVSADNVVDGDLKLILGLIWTLFVYSTSNSISLRNEAKSFAELKSILLRWLNDLGRRRALPEIRNFDKDWSLQRNARPDLVLASVVDFYIPNFVSYSDFLEGKKLANLDHIISLAWEDLQIPKLAEADDFNVLVPDEKCIILYVLQWYMFFEVQEDGDDQPIDQVDSHTMVQFITGVLEAVKVRNKYETKALRLVNQLNNNLSKLGVFLIHIDTHIASVGIISSLDDFCGNIDPHQPAVTQIASRESWLQINTYMETFLELLEKYQHFRLVLKPEYAYHDFPELKSLFKAVNAKLKALGLFSGYVPLKLLNLDSMGARLQRLMEADVDLACKVSNELEQVLQSKLRSLDLLIDSLEQNLCSGADKNHSTEVRAFLDNLDCLLRFKSQMSQAQELLKGTHSTSDIRVMVDTMDTLLVPTTPVTPEDSGFARFKDLVKIQKNRTNLTFSDARAFMKTVVPDQEIGATVLSDFIGLIPTRRLLNRSESDDFSIMYNSDDSEETAPIFDQVQKTLEHKLLGNHNKLYDLESLVAKLENGFRV